MMEDTDLITNVSLGNKSLTFDESKILSVLTAKTSSVLSVANLALAMRWITSVTLDIHVQLDLQVPVL